MGIFGWAKKGQRPKSALAEALDREKDLSAAQWARLERKSADEVRRLSRPARESAPRDDELFRPGFIRTFTGRYINPLDPDPREIVIEDIAHSLALQNRWTGHTIRPYTVAEHSIHACDLRGGPLWLERLMHDATEAYLVDLPSPLKNDPEFGRGFREAEARLYAVIARKFGLAEVLPAEVHEIDEELLRAEMQVLMVGVPPPLIGLKPAVWRVQRGLEGNLEDMFLRRFYHYAYERQRAVVAASGMASCLGMEMG